MRFWYFYIFLIISLIVAGFSFGQKFFRKENNHQKTVLFLCVHNTFRSQIAEAYFNKLAKEKNLKWQAKSAGFLRADKINQKAIILMAEEGIEISDRRPKLVSEEMIKKAERIIVVCKECEEMGLCLSLPKDKEVEYWRLENPAEMELEKAREIRNLIKEKVTLLIERLEQSPK